jgi:hypothetical protein
MDCAPEEAREERACHRCTSHCIFTSSSAPKEHHRITTFQEEYVAMLKRGLVEYDEKYLW